MRGSDVATDSAPFCDRSASEGVGSSGYPTIRGVGPAFMLVVVAKYAAVSKSCCVRASFAVLGVVNAAIFE